MLNALGLLLLLGGGSSTAAVVINEFNYDHTGTDDREYVELYNRSGAPVDISGWTLTATDPTTTNPTYTIPAATILAAGDYYVLGSALVPGVDQVVGATNLWENDNESLTLRDATTAIVDTLVYEGNKGVWDATLAEGTAIWGNVTMTTTVAAPAFGGRLSWSRIDDGYDSNNNGRDFAQMPLTPGASNNLPSLLPYAENFDSLLVGSEPAAFLGSFVNPRVIDPTVVDANNLAAIPASPQGGNALILWDPSGGGNAPVFLSAATTRIDLECLVYLEPGNPTAGDFETFTIGFAGTTDTFHNHPDVTGLLSSNGVTGLIDPNTGIAWEYATYTNATPASTAVLALIDEEDGGAGHVTLGSVPIVAGTNDGWQRIRLRVNGSRVDGWFGGPLGTTEGTHFGGTLLSPGPGVVYFGYRELVLANATARPLTIDALTIRAAEAGVDYVIPSPFCAGSGGCAPSIGWSGGDASVSAAGPFSIDLDNAFSPSTAFLVMGLVNTVPFPLNLDTIFFPPTGIPCMLLQDFPILIPVPVAGAGACLGTASFGVPSLFGGTVGSSIYVQWAVIDPLGPIAVPITMSDGLAITYQP